MLKIILYMVEIMLLAHDKKEVCGIILTDQSQST